MFTILVQQNKKTFCVRRIITSNLKSEKNTEDSAHKRRFEEEDSNPATQSEPKRKSALSEIIEVCLDDAWNWTRIFTRIFTYK